MMITMVSSRDKSWSNELQDGYGNLERFPDGLGSGKRPEIVLPARTSVSCK
jgi:hypothetical protein